MNRPLKFILSAFLISAILISGVSICSAYEGKQYRRGEYNDIYHRHGEYDAGYDPDYDCNENDTIKTKYFVNEKFARADSDTVSINGVSNCPSGWDADVSGGKLECTYYNCNFKMIDTSSSSSVKMTRDFEKAKFGIVTLETQLCIPDSHTDGISIGIYSDDAAAVKLITSGNKVYLDSQEKKYLFDYFPDVWYGIKIIFDIDKNIITEINLNGKSVCGNLPFINPCTYVNNFVMSTGAESTGTLAVNIVKIYRGYIINETFVSSLNRIPSDFETSGTVSVEEMKSNVPPDTRSLKLTCGVAESSVTKKIDSVSQKNISLSQYIYTNPKTDGIYISASDGYGRNFTIVTDSGKIGYKDVDGKIIYLCDYKSNVWYRIDINADLKNNCADVYVNYRKYADSVKISIGKVRSYTAGINKAGSFFIDDILLCEATDNDEDYVPEPQAVESGDYLVGMQFCPMWQNGYNIGYDYANADKDRLSYLGYYDEDSPEAMDWMIKWQTEHAISFMKVCWAGSYDSAPPKYAYLGGSFMHAYFKSKYKDLLPFMIMWENGINSCSTDKFLKDIAPYWIEYYLKSDNYLKIDGRPVVSIYDFGKFVSVQAGGSVDEAKRCIEQFKEMCISEGVGDPIITVGMYPGDKEIKNIEYIGGEGIQTYGILDATKANEIYTALRNTSEMLTGGKVAVTPTVGAGTDGMVGNSTSTAVLTKKQFKEELMSLKDNFISTGSGPLKNIINLDTWDEYVEGHWLAPSGRYGFDYLDAVREVFGDDEKHIDSAPDMKQKDRFNDYYPYARFLPPFKKEKAKGALSADNSSVVCGWYFDSDTEGWIGENVSGLKIENGCLSAVPTNGDPMVYIKNLDIDLKNITHVRVKFMPSVKSSVNQIFFGTDKNPWFSEERSFKFGVYKDGMSEYTLWLGSNTYFNGILKELRFDPGGYMDGGAFWIDSIELLCDDTNAPEIIGMSYENNAVNLMFNNDMGESAFDAYNYSIDGIRAHSVEKAGDGKYKIFFDAPVKNGVHTFTAGGLSDVYDQCLPLYVNEFISDKTVALYPLETRDFSGTYNNSDGCIILGTDLGGRYHNYQTSIWHSILTVRNFDDDSKYIFKTGTNPPDIFTVNGAATNLSSSEIIYTSSDSTPKRVLKYEPLSESADMLFDYPASLKDGEDHIICLKFTARADKSGIPVYWGKDRIILSDKYSEYMFMKKYNSNDAQNYYYRDRAIYLNTDVGDAFYIGDMQLCELSTKCDIAFKVTDTSLGKSVTAYVTNTEYVKNKSAKLVLVLYYGNKLTDISIVAADDSNAGANLTIPYGLSEKWSIKACIWSDMRPILKSEKLTDKEE